MMNCQLGIEMVEEQAKVISNVNPRPPGIYRLRMVATEQTSTHYVPAATLPCLLRTAAQTGRYGYIQGGLFGPLRHQRTLCSCLITIQDGSQGRKLNTCCFYEKSGRQRKVLHILITVQYKLAANPESPGKKTADCCDCFRGSQLFVKQVQLSRHGRGHSIHHPELEQSFSGAN